MSPSVALVALVALPAAPESDLGVSYKSKRSRMLPCALLMVFMALPFSGASR